MHIRRLFDLEGRLAVVTGGAGLYGSPITEALAEAGAQVVIASRDVDRCRECAEKMESKGLMVSAESYDQGNPGSIARLRDRVMKEHGRIDILVNNSVARPMQGYDDPLECWEESMAVNATGLFAVCRAFLEPMMQRGQGSMINIASIQGVVAPDFRNYEGTDMTTPPDYHFHKHGLIGLTKYLAAWAGARNVRVNAISPGGYNPGDAGEPFLSQYLRRVYLGRMAGYDDIKGAVVYLASEASSYVTGHNLIVDGGYTC